VAYDLRALGGLRLSRSTDESTSPERQTGRINWWASGNNAEVIHIAEDLDVSGAVSPFEREGLGPWLTDEKAHEWDVLVAWKLDRISRSAMDTLLLLQWCEERGKRIVCVDDGLDSGTKMGRIWIQLAAIFAEVERSFIEERTQASRAELRRTGRWPGGTPPWGYMPERLSEGGFKLVPHPERAPIVVKMARAVIGAEKLRDTDEKIPPLGYSYMTIAEWLNETGVPAPRKGTKRGWTGVTVARLLENPTVLWGKSTHNSQIMEFVDYAKPLLTPLDAHRLDQAMKARARGVATGRGATKFLTGIIYCGECGSKMYHAKIGKGYEYYRCQGRTHLKLDCANQNVPAAIVEQYVENEFLARVGTEEVFSKVEIPGSDHTAELAAVKERIRKLADMFASGALDNDDADFVESLAALKRRKTELEKLPKTGPQTLMVPTDVHYFDVWQESDNDTRRTVLFDRGVRVVIRKPRDEDAEIRDDELTVNLDEIEQFDEAAKAAKLAEARKVAMHRKRLAFALDDTKAA
jgi:DNA invertase Pin-like site-specific DNA recombinase